MKTQHHIASRVSRQRHERMLKRPFSTRDFVPLLDALAQNLPNMLKQYQQSIVAFGQALEAILEAQRVRSNENTEI